MWKIQFKKKGGKFDDIQLFETVHADAMALEYRERTAGECGLEVGQHSHHFITPCGDEIKFIWERHDRGFRFIGSGNTGEICGIHINRQAKEEFRKSPDHRIIQNFIKELENQ